MSVVNPELELDYAYRNWKSNGGYFNDEIAKSLKKCRAKHADFGKELNKYELTFCNYVGKRILEI